MTWRAFATALLNHPPEGEFEMRIAQRMADRILELENAILDLSQHGHHPGPCVPGQTELDPCPRHIAAWHARVESAQRTLTKPVG